MTHSPFIILSSIALRITSTTTLSFLTLYQAPTAKNLPMAMAEIHGSCEPAFESVRGILQDQFAQGNEVGASLCVNIDGKNVVDLWGGHADTEKTKQWDKDTVTGVFSSTKVVTGLAAHILIDRGLLHVNEKFASYWPEFGSNGKGDAKVSHILSHSSGVLAWEGVITPEEVQDVESSTKRLAAQAPWYRPGS